MSDNCAHGKTCQHMNSPSQFLPSGFNLYPALQLQEWLPTELWQLWAQTWSSSAHSSMSAWEDRECTYIPYCITFGFMGTMAHNCKNCIGIDILCSRSIYRTFACSNLVIALLGSCMSCKQCTFTALHCCQGGTHFYRNTQMIHHCLCTSARSHQCSLHIHQHLWKEHISSSFTTQLAHTTTLTITVATITVQCVPSTTVTVVGANSVVTVV